MGSYPIEATSLSFNDIKQNLLDFVQAKPDANRWRDFYTGGEGTILIELIAGYGFYTALKIIFAREETYLQYANTLLSSRAIALNLAYSAFRGTNRRYRVKFTPKVTASIPVFTVIGYQGEHDFIALGYEDKEGNLVLGDIILNENEEITVYGAVGTFDSLSLEIPSADLHVFRFNADLISNDFKLYLNDNEVPTTAINREALEDRYLVQSNAAGGVNVTYLNLNENFSYKYKTGDILRLDYIRYQNIPYVTEINIDYSDSAEIVATENTVLAETIESIQVKAPTMFETQQLIRSREDYVKNFLQLGTKFVDTTGRDLSPAYLELSYVQSDRMLLTQDELNRIMNNLTYSRMFGVPMPYINKPRFTRIKLNVALKLVSSNITKAEYNETVKNVFKPVTSRFSDVLHELFIDLAENEKLLEAEPNIKRASVSNTLEAFRPSEYYQLGDTFYEEESDYLYRVTNITYTTRDVEPKWNHELYSYTDDGPIVWQAVPQSGFPNAWAPKEDIQLYDLRVPTNQEKIGIMFRAVRGKSVSSVSADTFEWNTEIGSTTEDNELIWLCIEHVDTAPQWEVNTWYDLGDIVKVGSSSFQVIGERRKVSNTAPVLTDNPESLFYENLVLTRETLEEELIGLPWATYCVIEPIITASVT